MNALEVNVLLTQAALFDRWMVRSPEQQAEVAQAWAALLADVPVDIGMEAVRDHYSVEKRSIMVADIRDFAADHVELARNITELRLRRERAVALSAGERYMPEVTS